MPADRTSAGMWRTGFSSSQKLMAAAATADASTPARQIGLGDAMRSNRMINNGQCHR